MPQGADQEAYTDIVPLLQCSMNLSQRVAVKVVAIYAAVGFVVMEILYLGVWCRPFNQYWAVPTDNIQCSAATNHLITSE